MIAGSLLISRRRAITATRGRRWGRRGNRLPRHAALLDIGIIAGRMLTVVPGLPAIPAGIIIRIVIDIFVGDVERIGIDRSTVEEPISTGEPPPAEMPVAPTVIPTASNPCCMLRRTEMPKIRMRGEAHMRPAVMRAAPMRGRTRRRSAVGVSVKRAMAALGI